MDVPPEARPDATPPGRPRPVFARHAVSLLLYRHGKEGVEVLMGVRDARHRFMPNRLVFPGGAVDPADATSPAAAEPSASLMAALGVAARPGLARAIAAAAARELEEETGLTLGTPPRLDGMHYLCRAITPPASPIRFNARFLVAPAEAASGTLADSRELHDLRWYAAAAVQDGVMEVTREVLHRLVDWLALPRAEAGDPSAFRVFRDKRWQPDRRRGAGTRS